MAIATVIVKTKEGILDPQAKAIHHAMEGLSFKDCASVVSGKYFELEFPGLDNEKTLEKADEAARRILVNPNIESYRVEIKENL